MRSPLPIVVDLDDTLAKTDFFYESLLKFIKLNPLNFFKAIIWVATKGKAYLKSRIVEIVTIDASLIPYNKDVIEYIKLKKQQTHPIVLATATHRNFAEAVASYLNLFDQVFATDDKENLKGSNKEKKLVKEFGKQGFIYIGDSHADLKVWSSAKAAVVVSSSKNLLEKVESVTQLEKIISSDHKQPSKSQLLYSPDWIKNLLIFIPMLVLGLWNNIQVWLMLVIAFVSMCLCATSINIFSELFDLDAIRKDKNTSNSIYGSGQLKILQGVGLALISLIGSIILSLIVSVEVMIAVVIYFLFVTSHFIYFQSIAPKSIPYAYMIAAPIFIGYLAVWGS